MAPHLAGVRSESGVALVPRERFVSARAPPLGNEPFAKVVLGSERIVRRATQRQIRGHVRTVLREWLQMVQLEIARFSAAQATRVDIRAARAVAPIHLAPHRRGDVSAALATLTPRFRRPSGAVHQRLDRFAAQAR